MPRGKKRKGTKSLLVGDGGGGDEAQVLNPVSEDAPPPKAGKTRRDRKAAQGNEVVDEVAFVEDAPSLEVGKKCRGREPAKGDGDKVENLESAAEDASPQEGGKKRKGRKAGKGDVGGDKAAILDPVPEDAPPAEAGKKRRAGKALNGVGDGGEVQNLDFFARDASAQEARDGGKDEIEGGGLSTKSAGKKQKSDKRKKLMEAGDGCAVEPILESGVQRFVKKLAKVDMAEGSSGRKDRGDPECTGAASAKQIAENADKSKSPGSSGCEVPALEAGRLERDGCLDAGLGERSDRADNAAVEPALVEQAISYLRLRLVGIATDDTARLEELMLKEIEENKRNLHLLLHNTVEAAYNNSALLLGPRGCGKSLVLETVLAELQKAFPDRLAPVRLNGLLHADERASLKEIARQLCLEHKMVFSKASSFDENLCFLTDMLRECANAHRAVIFVLDEFDLFAQRAKQTVLYNLLDAMQSSQAQAAVVGISCRLDADQLLEKRVRSRFSHRRFLFLPPTPQDAPLLLKKALSLQQSPALTGTAFAARFEEDLEGLLRMPRMQILLYNFTSTDLSPRRLMDLAFRAVCNMDRTRSTLSFEDFKLAAAALRVPPKMSLLKGVSVLELFLLVAMKRLEGKERDAYNFHTVFTEYEQLRKAGVQSSADLYSRSVALRAFEHLVERELVGFTDGRGSLSGMPEFRMAQLLITASELEAALKACPTCPNVLKSWFTNEAVNRAA